ncbi:MAG: 50S ribosomal protein L29 [Deltaproteobacteria bacterium RIFOXYD12_FULL_55_16]|nr:MAG: 50S ribosomal protein L29 [Deltaproteobacteria bacterium RIFOXYD12_FULL_55_16]
MKIKEIRELGQEALVVKVRELSEEHFKLKFQHGIRPLENTAKLRQLRKEIARLQTALTAYTV